MSPEERWAMRWAFAIGVMLALGFIVATPPKVDPPPDVNLVRAEGVTTLMLDRALTEREVRDLSGCALGNVAQVCFLDYMHPTDGGSVGTICFSCPKKEITP